MLILVPQLPEQFPDCLKNLFKMSEPGRTICRKRRCWNQKKLVISVAYLTMFFCVCTRFLLIIFIIITHFYFISVTYAHYYYLYFLLSSELDPIRNSVPVLTLWTLFSTLNFRSLPICMLVRVLWCKEMKLFHLRSMNFQNKFILWK